MSTAETNGDRPVIVVGAGLAGLVCATMLVSRGIPVLVLEAEDQPGGRVRTDTMSDGFRIDRGFQVFFSAYPALRRHVPLAALQPRYFGAGVEVVVDGKARVFGHPLLDPTTIGSSVRSGLATAGDSGFLLRTLAGVPRSVDRALKSTGVSAEADAARSGASPQFLDGVMRPLFGGISLDRSLSSDASFWRFVVRSMLFGRVFLPAFGAGQLSSILASRLPRSALRLGTKVTNLLFEENAIQGVQVGTRALVGRAVVVASDAPAAQRLTNIDMPQGVRSCTTVYFSSNRPITASNRLMLNAESSLVSHAVQLTNIAPEYAPEGKHLLSATSLDVLPGGDEEVAAAVAADLRSWLPGASTAGLEPKAVVRVPFAQFAQGPGIYDCLPAPSTATRGLFLGGEFLHSSSVQGAMRGGELAACAVMAFLKP